MNLRKLTKEEKTATILKRSKDREEMYERCLKLFHLCDVKGLRFIVENPFAQAHYLINNFPYKAAVIDRDRTMRGDYYKKPTQYWFVNCEPTNGCTLQPSEVRKRVGSAKPSIKGGLCSEDRSMISPDYARNFICDFILGKGQPEICPTLFD